MVFITALSPDPREPGHLIVVLDGARYASLPLEVVSALGLVEGEDLEPQQERPLKKAAAAEAAYTVGLRLVAMRPRSRYELVRGLKERGHHPDAVHQAVTRLETERLLDDSEFARHFVRTRAPRGHGPSRLLSDLLSRGLERPVAEGAIREVSEDEGINAQEQARQLATKRAKQLQGVPARQKQRRLLAYLARRGFRGAWVKAIVAGALQGD